MVQRNKFRFLQVFGKISYDFRWFAAVIFPEIRTQFFSLLFFSALIIAIRDVSRGVTLLRHIVRTVKTDYSVAVLLLTLRLARFFFFLFLIEIVCRFFDFHSTVH